MFGECDVRRGRLTTQREGDPLLPSDFDDTGDPYPTSLPIRNSHSDNTIKLGCERWSVIHEHVVDIPQNRGGMHYEE